MAREIEPESQTELRSCADSCGKSKLGSLVATNLIPEDLCVTPVVG